MKTWIYGAICLLVIGTVIPLIQGDGEGVAIGFIGGLGVLLVVLALSSLVWLCRRILGKKDAG